MHTLFVVPAYTPFIGGAQSFVRAMGRRLVADGQQVTVLAANVRRSDDFWRPAADEPLPSQEEVEGVRIVRLAVRYLWPAPYRFGLLRRIGHWLQRSPLPPGLQLPLLSYLARSMPPLVDLQSTMTGLVAEATRVQALDATWDGLFTAASRAAHQAGKPFVAMPLIHTGSAHILAHFTMAHQLAAYRHADAVIALSRPERNLLASHSIPASRLHLLSMGVEMHNENVDIHLSTGFSNCYNLNRPFVAFLGATTYDKGAFTLAQAILDLNRRGIDLDLVCAGPQQEQLQQFLAEIHSGEDRALLQERVHLLGIVDEPAKQAMLAASTLLALPSRVDSFGIALLEAWQHGKPVIAAAEGGLVDTVTDGETGLLTPFGDVSALSAALERLLQDRGLAQRLGESGQCAVMARYSWNHTYETLLKLYEKINGSGKPN